LLPARERFGQSVHDRLAQSVHRRMRATVDQLDRGGLALLGTDSLLEFQQSHAAQTRPGPGFERRRGRSQDDREAEQLRALDREVARRIANAFAGLVRGVVFLVDDDEREAR
jgi:hypothetical protein